MTYWEAWVIGTSGPIAADGGGPVERDQIALKLVRAGAERTSSMCIGRGRSICEYDEIMQILPGSSDDAELINALRVICNIAVGVHSIVSKRTPGFGLRVFLTRTGRHFA
jgi:hypothetical protein